MWVRGLKRKHLSKYSDEKIVAPYVGAWIETYNSAVAQRQRLVAPYVGAWIETELQG